MHPAANALWAYKARSRSRLTRLRSAIKNGDGGELRTEDFPELMCAPLSGDFDAGLFLPADLPAGLVTEPSVIFGMRGIAPAACSDAAWSGGALSGIAAGRGVAAAARLATKCADSRRLSDLVEQAQQPRRQAR